MPLPMKAPLPRWGMTIAQHEQWHLWDLGARHFLQGKMNFWQISSDINKSNLSSQEHSLISISLGIIWVWSGIT